MGSASDTPPDAFIITDTPGSQWNINESTIWKAIFADPTLGLAFPTSNTPSGTITISCAHFWDLSFSNQANTAIFNSNTPVATDSHFPANNPIQGGVLGMVKPATGDLTSTIAFDTVAGKFGISSATAPPLLKSFLSTVDSGSIALSLDVTSTTRNALWAVPGGFYQIVVSLTFNMTTTGSVNQIQSFINQQFGLNLSISAINPQVIFTSFTSYNQSTTDPSSVTVSSTPNYNMIVQFEIAEFTIAALFTSTDVELIFSDVGTPSANTSIFQRLQSAGLTSSSAPGGSGSLSAKALPDSTKSNPSAFDKFLDEVKLWYLTIGFDNVDPSSSTSTNGDIYWSVGLLGQFSIKSGSPKLLVALTYDTRTTQFDGYLVTSKNIPSPSQYDFQTWQLIPASLLPTTTSVDISSVFGGNKPPSSFPSAISEASIIYQQGADRNSYSFSANLVLGTNPSNPSTGGAGSGSAVAPSAFDWAFIKVNLLLQNDGTNSTTNLQVLSYIPLSLAPSSLPTASSGIVLDLQYNSAKDFWLLLVEADMIQITNLTGYFDQSIGTHVQSTIGSLYVKSLNILYNFNGAGDASSFLFTGALVLGDLELDLFYQYQSGTPSTSGQPASSLVWGSKPPANVSSPSAASPWVFEAFLGAADATTTLQKVIQSIRPGITLPSFVANITVNTSSGGNSPGKLKLLPVDGGLLLIVQFILADLDFTFVSLSTTDSSHMIFRISVDKIPLIDSIPLTKALPQPFDSMLYFYLDGETGLNQTDFDLINTQLASLNIPKLIAKTTQDASAGSSEEVIQAGHHFMVLQGTNVVLDHVFSDEAAQSQDPSDPSDPNSSAAVGASDKRVVLRSAVAASDSGGDPAPTKGNLDVQLPFLSISGLTFQFKQASLYIDIDATMLLGPINLTIIGFEIVLHLSKVTLNDFSNMLTNGFITFGIHGLSLSIDESPLEIAGVFIHNIGTDPSGNTVDEYMGGVAVGFEAWQFVAVGAYEIITSPSNYKSVFIYAKLNGPLFSLGFATVSGVRMGFGYNSVVRSPTMAELPNFPFLDGSAENGAGNDPLKILNAMTGSGSGKPWVAPQEDAYWGAVVRLSLPLACSKLIYKGFDIDSLWYVVSHSSSDAWFP
jgi:uncharacterized protein DUF6603